jgi:radical SAM superfamily enzyme YgiQ (UPF0313 family)
MPIGLTSIAAYIRERGFSVIIIDGDRQSIKKELSKIGKNVGVVGVTATTDKVISAYRICEYIKTHVSKDICCVLGGPHATALPRETLEESLFDIVVVGEGEETMLEILKSFYETGAVPTDIAGTAAKKNGNIIINNPREVIKDLDSLPFPAYDLVAPDTYLHGIKGEFGSAKRAMLLLLGRGCPYDCVFCSSKIMWKRKLRFPSVGRIIELLQFLISKYHVDGFVFADDELTTNRKFITEFCDALTTSGIAKQIKWSCQARATSVDRELIRKLKEAGCVLVRCGFESGSERILKFLKKGTVTVEQNKNAALICREESMPCYSSFIIGSPEETVDDIVDTIDFIERYMHDHVDVYIVVPYPGTDLYFRCKEQNLLRTPLEWSDFVIEGRNVLPIIRNEHFTSEQLLNIHRYINIHVVSPLNSGRKREKLDHKKEIERILAGDKSMTEYSFRDKLKRKIVFFYKATRVGITHPNMVVRHLNKMRWRHENSRI